MGRCNNKSTSVDNKSKNINANDLIAFAEKYDLENYKFILDQVQNAISIWKYYAKEAGVSKQSINIIQKNLNEVR